MRFGITLLCGLALLSSGCFFKVKHGDNSSQAGIAGLVILQDVKGEAEESYVRAGFANISGRENNPRQILRQSVEGWSGFLSGAPSSMQCASGEIQETTNASVGWVSVGTLSYGEVDGILEEVEMLQDRSYLKMLDEAFDSNRKKVAATGIQKVAPFAFKTPVPVPLSQPQANEIYLSDKKTIPLIRNEPLRVRWELPEDVSEYNLMGVDLILEAGGKKYGMECVALEKDFKAERGIASWEIPAKFLEKFPQGAKGSIRVSRSHRFNMNPPGYRYLLVDIYRSWVVDAEVN